MKKWSDCKEVLSGDGTSFSLSACAYMGHRENLLVF